MERNYIHGIAKYEKMPVIYEETENGVYCYDGENYGYITTEQKRELRSLKTPHILIKKNDKEDKDKDLEEIYDEFIKDADELKKETKEVINMYKTGRDTQTAIYLAFKFLNEKKIIPDPITLKEYEWLEDASQGALIFGEKYAGEGYKYDLNSAYPSIYSSCYFLIPIKEGEFRTITKDDFENKKFYQNGIYRVSISYPNKNTKYPKLFKLNNTNKYTHIDLTYAKKLKLKMELIEDGKENFLYYSRDKCKTGSECFKEFVNLLYPLRKNPIIKARCKTFLRCLWGALSQRNIRKIALDFDQEYEVYEGKEVILIKMLENKYEIITIPKDQPYEFNWARMKPFLLAKGRVKIAECMQPNIHNIYRCHTDGFISDVKLYIETSMELGKLKYEGYCGWCIIENSQIVRGLFVIDNVII